MLKPRGREYLIAPQYFSHIFACCFLNFHSLSLCRLHTIKTSHSVGTTGRILRNKLTNHASPARISINKNSANAYAYSHKMFAPAMLKAFRRLCATVRPAVDIQRATVVSYVQNALICRRKTRVMSSHSPDDSCKVFASRALAVYLWTAGCTMFSRCPSLCACVHACSGGGLPSTSSFIFYRG